MKNENAAGRRRFLKTAAAGTAALTMASGGGTVFGATSESAPRDPGNKWPGTVALNFNKDAIKNDTIDDAAVFKMVDETVKLLTGQSDVGDAWRSLFPATLSQSSKIAVKVICYNPYKVGLNWQTVKGVTEGLQKMMVDGQPFPASNITIYELTTSPTRDAFTVAGYTKERFPGITITTDKSKMVKAGDGALNDREYAQALKDADFLINCFNARGHAYGDSDGKFTLGFKSHFGTYTDPNGMHGAPAGSGVSKNVREITCTGPVFKKHVVSICGALFGSNEGNGPGGISGRDDLAPEDFSTYVSSIDSNAACKNPSTIIMSTDPASIEMQAIKLLRINKKKPYGVEQLPAYLQSAAGIDKSGFSPTYNIGIIDESRMQLYKMVNGEVISGRVAVHTAASLRTASAQLTVHPLGGAGSVFIDFNLPQHFSGESAVVDIVDVRGALVRMLRHHVAGSNNHLSWDRKDARGAMVKSGRYIVRLTCGSTRLTAPCTITG